MRYMMLIKATDGYEAGASPNAALMTGMAKLGKEGARSGVLLAAAGLLPSSHGARVGHSARGRFVIDGPFAETKELLGGYAIVEAKSRDEAIELAQRVVDIHVGAGEAEVEIEVRPLAGDPQPGPAR
jgi:hypothetical protein